MAPLTPRSRPTSRGEIQVAVICAKALEADAVLCALDEFYEDDTPQRLGKSSGDPNTYVYGRCGQHYVVVVTTPRIGKSAAKGTARALRMSFGGIKLALLVGVCGAVPRKLDNTDILFGDVVISETVVELDAGRLLPSGFARRNATLRDVHGRPSEEILSLLERWKSVVQYRALCRQSSRNLPRIQEKLGPGAQYPGRGEDRLFDPGYSHKHRTNCTICCADPAGPACEDALKAECRELQCDERMLVSRQSMERADTQATDATLDTDPPAQFIHFGSIGTSDMVIRSGEHRDHYAKSERIIAFEMEGTAVWEDFQCLIIKGVCDYADAHKSHQWQGYAAARAAAVMRGVLAQYVKPDAPSQPRHTLDNPTALAHNCLVFRPSTPLALISSARDMFDCSLREFRGLVETDKFPDFQPARLRELSRDLKKIQDEQERSKSLRNLRRLQSFVERVAQIGNIMDVCLETPEAVNYIWGAVSFLLQVAWKSTEWLDTLLTAYEKIGKAIPTLSDETLFQTHTSLLQVVALVFRDILEFHQIAMDIFSATGTLKETFQPLWGNFVPTFNHIVTHIGSHARLLNTIVPTIYHNGDFLLKDVDNIRAHIDQYEKDRLTLRQEEERRQQTRYDTVREWLTGADVALRHQEICEDRRIYDKSGDWILGEEKVKKWLSPENSTHSVLWINGRPGTGKTYLASVLIEACAQDKSGATAYFYCRPESKESSTAMPVLRGILSQLMRQCTDLVPYCDDKRRNSGSVRFSEAKAIPAMLKTFCKRIPHTYIIIDGLDECVSENERGILLEKLKELVKSCENYALGKLRVLFLSQPSDDIRNALDDWADHFTLTPEHSARDIERYCRARILELRKFDLADEEIDTVLRMTCERADGMFLFAKLVMDNLQGQPTAARLFDIIVEEGRFPKDIDAAYSRIMERLRKDLTPSQFDHTQLLLGWLVRSKRPLKGLEIQTALSTNLSLRTDFGELDTLSKLGDHIQKLCGSLVQILDGDRFELVHSTARIYIARQDDINIDAAECDLALRCLRYLTLNFFQEHIPDATLKSHVKEGDLAFQDYAVSTWFMHVSSIMKAKLDIFKGATSSPDRDFRPLEEKISKELENFVSFYEASFPNDDILDQARQECKVFESYDFHENLLRVWNHICTEQSKDYAARNNVSLKLLDKSLTRNRAMIEQIFKDGSSDLSSYYGEYAYRCPKVLCFYFHEGFRDQKVRDHHVNRHTLPHHCNVPDCSMGGLGFANENLLKAHERKFHPEKYLLSESFASLTRGKVEKTQWQCPQCHRNFARNQILKDHINSHNGNRPFQCSECKKSFTRKNDLRRHEATHDRRRQLH